jgi:hypothetical protein
MELLDRYLQAVKRYLPMRRQDDIIAELRANMESQIEDRESELGRPLTQGEFEDLLRTMGPPVVVASRYQPQQYLIGPTFFPLYLYVLRMALLWAFIICVIVTSVVIPLTTQSGGEVFASLFRIPGILIQVAGWVTLVFAAIEFARTRYPNVCPPIAGMMDNWHPSSLPPLEKDATGKGKARSYAQAIAEIIFGCLFLVWLLLIPRYPFLILGPGVVYVHVGPFQLAPVWWTFFWWVVALNMLQLVWKCVDLARERWQYPGRVQRMVFQAAGLIPLVILLTVRDRSYVLLKNPAVDQLHYGHTLDQINNGIHLGAAVLCTIVVLQIAADIAKMARDAYRQGQTTR